MSEVEIDICLCTFKRPDLLKQTLTSLQVVEIPENVSFKVIVVDNDSHASAKNIVLNFIKNNHIKIIYAIEERQNISHARNKTLALSTAEYVIFIDDDEQVDKKWLVELIKCQQEYDADVVHGPVVPQYPEETPKWIEEGKYFDRKRWETGANLLFCGCNNTLVKAESLKQLDYYFDSNYGLTGGEDTELFSRLFEADGKMIWCDEAIVTETVLPNRVNINWLLKRAFRGGQCFARLNRKKNPTQFYMKTISLRLIYVCIAICLTVISLPFGKKYYVKWLQKICTNIGQLSIVFGRYHKEYIS